MKIELTKGKWAVIDDEAYELVSQCKRWWAVLNHGTWYAYGSEPNPETGRSRTLYMHRVIAGLKTHDPRKIDHRDGDGLNNRRGNLRITANKQNRWNSRANGGSSLYKGVTWNKYGGGTKGGWRARMTVDGVQHQLGCFESEEDAARVCDAFMIEHHGEYARLNFPEEADV